MTPTSRNLVRVFLLQDRLKAPGGKGRPPRCATCTSSAPASWAATSPPGAALRGFTVTLQDRALQYIEPALKRAAELFDKRLRDPAKNAAARGAAARGRRRRRGRPAPTSSSRRSSRTWTPSRSCTRALEPRMKPGRCSPPTPRASCSSRSRRSWRDPERLVGLHFFNPVAQMPLVEIVHSARTDPRRDAGRHRLRPAARQAAGAVPQRARLHGQPRAHALPARGHVCRRRKACRSRRSIARRCAFGMPMGPIELADVVGLDVAAHVGEIIARELGRPAPQLALRLAGCSRRRSSAARAARASMTGGTARR